MSDVIDDLMSEFYDVFSKEENRKKPKNEILSNFSEKHRVAVRFGNLNYQVCNGGFSQWAFTNNYYAADIEELLEFANLGVQKKVVGFEKIKDMLSEVNEEMINYEEYVDCFECGGNGEDPESFDELTRMYWENEDKALESVTKLILAM